MVSKPMNGVHKRLPMHDLDQESDKANQYDVHQPLKYDLIDRSELRDSKRGIENMPDAKHGQGQEQYREQEEHGENHEIRNAPRMLRYRLLRSEIGIGQWKTHSFERPLRRESRAR